VVSNSVMGAQAIQETNGVRLDNMLKEWSALRRFLMKHMNISPSVAEEAYVEENTRIMDNLVECVNTAQKVVSEASTRNGDNFSVDGEILTERRREGIRNWIPPPGIPEENDFPTREDNESEFSESRSDALPDDVFSTHPSNETAATSTQYSTSPKVPADDANFDLEARLINHWRKLGKQKYTQEHYEQAEGILIKALERGEKKFGKETQFEGKDETLEILACTFIKQSKMDQVEDLLNRYDTQFQGRERTVQMVITAHIKAGEWDNAESVLMKFTSDEKFDTGLENLINTCCQQGEWEFAEKLLRKHTEFEGREKMLEMIGMSCYKKRKWEEAETFLREFLKDKHEDNLRVLEAVHTLADVCLQNNKLEAAEDFCRRAVEGRQRLLNGRHPLFHQSVYVLVEICYAKEDPIEAEGYAEFLPASFQRMSIYAEH
jgi:tetratricopeptide (TPR) repeat protein